jgi:hypothetical protein
MPGKKRVTVGPSMIPATARVTTLLGTVDLAWVIEAGCQKQAEIKIFLRITTAGTGHGDPSLKSLELLQ